MAPKSPTACVSAVADAPFSPYSHQPIGTLNIGCIIFRMPFEGRHKTREPTSQEMKFQKVLDDLRGRSNPDCLHKLFSLLMDINFRVSNAFPDSGTPFLPMHLDPVAVGELRAQMCHVVEDHLARLQFTSVIDDMANRYFFRINMTT